MISAPVVSSTALKLLSVSSAAVDDQSWQDQWQDQYQGLNWRWNFVIYQFAD